MKTAGSILAVLAALGLLMLGVRALQRRRRAGPEAGRKLVHAGMGIIALPFPWIFSTARPVWLLAGLAITLLIIVRLVPAAARRFGQVLGGVQRASLGEIFYPLGVALAFTLATGDAGAFCGAVGVLAFADTAGALVGTRWGRRRYSLGGHPKSLEGSVAVWIASALCIGAAVVACGAKTWASGLKTGLVVGGAAALVEALLGYGLDNLILPPVIVELMK